MPKKEKKHKILNKKSGLSTKFDDTHKVTEISNAATPKKLQVLTTSVIKEKDIKVVAIRASKNKSIINASIAIT